MQLLGYFERNGGGQERPFSCPYEGCIKAFARQSDLNRHVRIHTNERPYACMYPGCNRRFVQSSSLRVHLNVHTGAKPYACEICTRAFGDTSSLSRHRRSHTGERPYKCLVPGCNREFCRRTTLRLHIERNHANIEDVPALLDAGRDVQSRNVPLTHADDSESLGNGMQCDPNELLQPNMLFQTPATPQHEQSLFMQLAHRRPGPQPQPLTMAHSEMSLKTDPWTPTVPVLPSRPLQTPMTVSASSSPQSWSSPVTPGFPLTPMPIQTQTRDMSKGMHLSGLGFDPSYWSPMLGASQTFPTQP